MADVIDFVAARRRKLRARARAQGIRSFVVRAWQNVTMRERVAVVSFYPEDVALLLARSECVEQHDEMIRDCTYVDDCAWFPSSRASGSFKRALPSVLAGVPFAEIEPVDIWEDGHRRVVPTVLAHVTTRDVWWSVDPLAEDPGLTTAMVAIAALADGPPAGRG